MTDNFLNPLPISDRQPKFNIDSDKIKNLEYRLMGPSSEGKLPMESEPCDCENIKTKILLNDSIIPQDDPPQTSNQIQKSSSKSSSNMKKKSSSKNVLDYLMNKRPRDSINENTNNINQLYSPNPEKNEITNNFSDFFSSKHLTKHNNLFPSEKVINSNHVLIKEGSLQGNGNLRDTNIIDYYGKTSRKLSENTIVKNSNSKNIKCLSNNKKENNITQEQSLKSELQEKNKYITEKEKEIIELKKKLNERELECNDLKNKSEILWDEIKKCRADICEFVKENEEYQRKERKREIHEKEFKIGKLSFQKITHGQLMDYWEDGEDLIFVKKKIEEIKNEKEELEKQKRRLSSNKSRQKANTQNNNYIDDHELEQDMRDVLSFKWNALQKKENELKEQKEKLEIEKGTLIHESNLFEQELKCTFGRRKDGWPLLDKRFQIIGLLGKGGYSEVYKAYDIEQHMIVACKLHQLNPNWKEEIKENYIKHTIRENQIHKDINHPKIVKHFQTIEIDNNSFCTILEYCTGPDLATYLQRNKNIGEKDARIIINQILLGLEYLNKLPKKIIHYDLKPENIIFNNMEVKISDFGLAKIIDNNKDKIQLTSQGVGTYWYLPPECFEENFDVNISSKVDIWSCGVILYEMFFRKKPFGQNYSQDKLLKEKIISNARKIEFPPKPVISEECKDFIKNCLAFKQDDRYDVFQALNSAFIKQEKSKK